MYAVLADAHLGALTEDDEKDFFLTLEELRSEGLRIIWLGDTFDLIWLKNAFTTYKGLIKDEDILLIGNHDFTLIDLKIGKRLHKLGSTCLTHGDYLDFGYFAARMQSYKDNLKRGNVITEVERIAYWFLKNWDLSDADKIFRLMVNLDEYILKMFDHDSSTKVNKFVALYRLYNLFKRAKKYLNDHSDTISPSYIDPLPEPPKKEHFFGYFTFDVNVLYDRFKHIYLTCEDSKTIIIGHIHKPADKTLPDETRFIIVGSWQRNDAAGIYPTVPILDADGNIIEIREYKRY